MKTFGPEIVIALLILVILGVMGAKIFADNRTADEICARLTEGERAWQYLECR